MRTLLVTLLLGTSLLLMALDQPRPAQAGVGVFHQTRDLGPEVVEPIADVSVFRTIERSLFPQLHLEIDDLVPQIVEFRLKLAGTRAIAVPDGSSTMRPSTSRLAPWPRG